MLTSQIKSAFNTTKEVVKFATNYPQSKTEFAFKITTAALWALGISNFLPFSNIITIPASALLGLYLGNKSFEVTKGFMVFSAVLSVFVHAGINAQRRVITTNVNNSSN
ncbi:MAG: hypothetical protein Tsb0021_18360 [Chlamydiales bacterium]